MLNLIYYILNSIATFEEEAVTFDEIRKRVHEVTNILLNCQSIHQKTKGAGV